MLKKKNFTSAAARLLLVIILATFGGCGPTGSGGASTPGYSGEVFTQKVYVIGEIKDPGTRHAAPIPMINGPVSAIKNVFVNRVPYDGLSTDAPVFIAADQVLMLSDFVKAGLLATYRNGHPIVLIYGNEAQINALLEIVGRNPNYRLPVNFSYAEVFAVDAEEGGNFAKVVYPPGATHFDDTADEYVGSLSGWEKRADKLLNWMKEDTTRPAALTAFEAEALNSLAAQGADTAKEELTNLARLNQHIALFTDPISGNSYQLLYNMYAFHAFSSADGRSYDWFYVEQIGTLNAATGYKGIRAATRDDVTLVNGGAMMGAQEVAAHYIGSYEMANSLMVLGEEKTDRSVVLQEHSPATENQKTSVTSGISFSIGGEVGFKIGGAPEAKGSVSTGLTISNQQTVVITDCTVQNKSMSSGFTDEARWLYSFTRPGQFAWIAIHTRLHDPVPLSVTTFQPVNKWIWKISPDVRDGKKKYQTKFKGTLTAENMVSVSGNAIFWILIEGPWHKGFKSTFEAHVPLDFPPVIVAPRRNITFTAAGQVKYLNVSVARDWWASCDQDWCQPVPTTGGGDNPQLSITVKANETGKERKATVTFRTLDGKGTDKMTVTQSQFLQASAQGASQLRLKAPPQPDPFRHFPGRDFVAILRRDTVA